MRNNKTITVFEYDSITSIERDTKEYGIHRIPEERFKELEDFIHNFTEASADSDVLDYMKIIYNKRGVGDIIKIKNYVGLIEMRNGFQIQILPKIDFAKDEKETKQVFLDMLRCLDLFPGKVFTDASLDVSKMNLYEVFINMYINAVQDLVKQGLRSGYISHEENLNHYKGKINVNEQIKYNLFHAERFFVSYDEFHPNRPENRLIKSTLLKLQKLTFNDENARRIRQLLSYFEFVEESSNIDSDFSKVVINRGTKEYETILQWSKVFLKNLSFSTFSGKQDARALLFPMEKVFESYVAKMMKRDFSKEGWKVKDQDRGKYLFSEPERRFPIQPDIVMRKDNRTIILDTKWKKLYKEEKNYGISQADMYQMYAYSKKYETGEIYLLYPLTQEMIDYPPIYYLSDDLTCIKVFFVDLVKKQNFLSDLHESINNVKRLEANMEEI